MGIQVGRAHQGAARISADDVYKDFVLLAGSSTGSIGLAHALQTKWIPQNHQSLAAAAAWTLAMYALHKAAPLLSQGSRVAWEKTVDLTNKRITLKATAVALLCGSLAGSYMTELLPPAAALSAGILAGLTAAYSSSN